MQIKQYVISILMLFTISVAHAEETYPKLPEKGSFVVDEAHVISPQALEKINLISSALWREESVPLVVVTIDSLAAMQSYQSIETYTSNLFNHWQLGRRDKNYGIILLISIKDRKSRIEFGAGWDNRYNNQAITITQDYLVPHFRQAQYSEGMVAGVQALNNLTRGLDLPKIQPPWWLLPLAIISIIGIIAVIVSLFKSGRSGWGWAFIVFIGIALWWIIANSRAGGSISGGGSSGGGGATGSW